MDPVSDTPTSIAARLSSRIADAFAGVYPVIDIAADAMNPAKLDLSFTSEAVTVDPTTGSTFGGAQTSDEVNLVAGPLLNDTVELTLGTDTIKFQLTPEGATPLAGNVGVELLPFDDPVSDAAKASATDSLMRAMNREFQTRNWGVSASIPDPGADPTRIVLQETAITAGRSLSTDRGEAIALFDHAGALIELYYLGKLDYNRDNNDPDVTGGDAFNYDAISFVATDDGISIDLHNNRFVYGTPKTAIWRPRTLRSNPLTTCSSQRRWKR